MHFCPALRRRLTHCRLKPTEESPAYSRRKSAGGAKEIFLRPSVAPVALLVTGGSQKALAPGYSRPALRASCSLRSPVEF
jgi:hypothetical protein